MNQTLKQKQTDSSYSESDCDEDVHTYLHEVNIANTNNFSEKNDDWIQVLDRDADQDNSPTLFSPVSCPGPVNCVTENVLPNEYF